MLATTPELRRELAGHARAELARRSLYWFVRASFAITNPGVRFEDNWHLRVVCDHVQWLLEGWGRSRRDPDFDQVCRDLLINMPPRCLKSTLVSVCAVAWAWLHWPELIIGSVSINPRVSFRDALATRSLIQSEWYQRSFEPPWQIRDDQGAVSSFANTAGGARISRGFESNVVGEGFDWIIVDDPHDPRDSAAAIQKVLDGWDIAVSSRTNDPRRSIRCGVMQCVTEGDFSDHVRKQGWGHLCLPMEFEPERVIVSPMGWRDPRTAGECLHPARFPAHVLEQIKLERGSYAYAAQYQQRPAPIAGGIIQRAWFRRFTLADLPATPDWTTITVDATFGSVEESADSVGLLVVAGVGPKRYVLCDASRKMSFLETIAAIKALLATYPQVKRVLVEKAAAGGPIVELMRRDIGQGALRTVVFDEINPREHGNKTDRVVASLPQLEAGLVHVLDGAPWVDAFIGEHGLFPNGQHDDRVDALSQLLIRYAGHTEARDRTKALIRARALLAR